MKAARIVIPHNDEDFHEWWFTGERVRANKNGVSNPRMYSAEWQKWQCNNTDCPAWALIKESFIATAIDTWGGPA